MGVFFNSIDGSRPSSQEYHQPPSSTDHPSSAIRSSKRKLSSSSIKEGGGGKKQHHSSPSWHWQKGTADWKEKKWRKDDKVEGKHPREEKKKVKEQGEKVVLALNSVLYFVAFFAGQCRGKSSKARQGGRGHKLFVIGGPVRQAAVAQFTRHPSASSSSIATTAVASSSSSSSPSSGEEASR